MRTSRILAFFLLVAVAGVHAAGPDSRAASGDAPTLLAVLEKIGRNYVEPARIEPPRMLRAAARALDREIPEARLESEDGDALTLDVAGERRTFSLASVRTLRDVGRELAGILRFVGEHRSAASEPVAEYVAANAILATLDPHSLLLDPAQAKEFATNLASRFFGIGIVFDSEGSALSGAPPGVPVIMEVFKGGPAEAAGVRACDRILAVENRWAAGLDWMELAGLLRGPDGSPVWVTLQRDGDARDLVVTRAEIKVPSVTSRRLEGDVGLIQIRSFASGTAAEVRSAVADLRKSGATSWILDLRGNFGGLLSQAIATASLFVRSGPVVTVVGEAGREREVKQVTRKPPSTLEEGPLAVLIGPSTASSAEVLAAALQNRNRAAVLGRTSWGKGSVQVLYDQADGSKLKLTIAHYLTPGGASLQSRGITPDIELVPVPLPEPDRVRLTVAEPAGREADLDRAFAPRAAADRSGLSLRYLAATPDAEEEIRIARDLLVAGRALERGDSLARGRALVDARREAEEAKIASAFAAAGVDWSAGPAGEAARLSIRCGQRAAAKDDRVPFECEVLNQGQTDAFRVFGRALSPAFDLKDEEVVVGRVPAGESRKVTLEGRLAEDPSPRVSWITFAFSGQGEAQVRKVPLRIEAAARVRRAKAGPPPRLEIRIDPGAPETRDEARTIRATIGGPGIRDAWVRVSNEDAKLDRKKVVYVSRSADAASGPLELAAVVPLKTGLNEIGVCSRAGDEGRCEKAFVYRLER